MAHNFMLVIPLKKNFDLSKGKFAREKEKDDN